MKLKRGAFSRFLTNNSLYLTNDTVYSAIFNPNRKILKLANGTSFYDLE